MNKLWWVIGASWGAVLLLILQSAPVGSAPWYLTRAAGFVAFVLLTGSVALGLVISSRASVIRVPKRLAVEMHQFASLLALVLTGIHMAALVVDDHVSYSVLDILAPFSAGSIAVGIGVAGFWALALVMTSSGLRRRIGYRAWRRLHAASFLAWGLALMHGLLAGTDSASALAGSMYSGASALVVGLLVFRLASVRGTNGKNLDGIRLGSGERIGSQSRSPVSRPKSRGPTAAASS